MPVIIENISPRDLPDSAQHDYRLRINHKTLATFKHQRDLGLAECLRRAADAVEKSGEAKWPATTPAEGDR